MLNPSPTARSQAHLVSALRSCDSVVHRCDAKTSITYSSTHLFGYVRYNMAEMLYIQSTIFDPSLVKIVTKAMK
jgi:hypothetical protein